MKTKYEENLKCRDMERVRVVKYIVRDSIKQNSFDSEYVVGEEIFDGVRPSCFPFPDLPPLPTEPSPGFLEIMAAKLRAEEEGEGGEGEGIAKETAPEGEEGGFESDEEPNVYDEFDMEEGEGEGEGEGEEIEVDFEEAKGSIVSFKKPLLKIVSRHMCMKRVHVNDIPDCRCRHDKFFAVKRLYKRTDVRLRPTEVFQVWRLVHPHLVRVHEVFEDKFWIFIVEDLVDSVDIISMLKEVDTLSEKYVAALTRQMLLGLKAMHDVGVVHLNLTPMNVIFDREWDRLRIADICVHQLVGEQSWRRTIKRFPGFFPPEMMTAPCSGLPSLDMWAVGIIVYMMVTLGKQPFLKDDGETVDYKAIMRGKVDWRDVRVSRSGKDFISKLLVPDPKARMTVVEALRHPWQQLKRRDRSDIYLKIAELPPEEGEGEEEEPDNCGCDISGQEDFDDEFDSDEESCHCDEPPWDEIVRIGINGLNNVGVRLLKDALKMGHIQVAAVNDASVGTDIDYLLYLVTSDSTRGPARHVNATYEDSHLVVPVGLGTGKQLKVYSMNASTPVPWKAAGVEYVFECEGAAEGVLENHFKGGAKRVIVLGPNSEKFPNIVVGYNDDEYNRKLKIVGSPEGGVFCLLPLLKILHETYGVHQVLATEIRPFSERFITVDGPSKSKWWREGRGSGQNMIPTPNSAGKVIGEVFKKLKGKVESISISVPATEVTAMDATFVLSNGAEWHHLKETLALEVAKEKYQDVIYLSEHELVSTDFRDETHACVLDMEASLAINDTFFKLVGWFNHLGVCCRGALDLATRMAHIDKRNVKLADTGPTAGQRLYDTLALTDPKKRSKGYSYDQGAIVIARELAKKEAAKKKPTDIRAPMKKPSQPLPQPPPPRTSAPAAILTGEFGFKPVEIPEPVPEEGAEVGT